MLSCRLLPSVFWECAPQELKTGTELCMSKGWNPLGVCWERAGNALGAGLLPELCLMPMQEVTVKILPFRCSALMPAESAGPEWIIRQKSFIL